MSLWSETYNQDTQPSFKDMDRFINSELWLQLNLVLQRDYNVIPTIQYSKCPSQKGWNVKYKKSGKALCTLYPMNNYFIALVVVNGKMEPEAEILIQECCAYLRDLFEKTSSSCGGRWLMIEVKDQNTLEDTLKLIKLRVITR